jgi:hypothetical protein
LIFVWKRNIWSLNSSLNIQYLLWTLWWWWRLLTMKLTFLFEPSMNPLMIQTIVFKNLHESCDTIVAIIRWYFNSFIVWVHKCPYWCEWLLTCPILSFFIFHSLYRSLIKQKDTTYGFCATFGVIIHGLRVHLHNSLNYSFMRIL